MIRRKVSVRDKQLRRLEYTCPKCGSTVIANNDRECKRVYSCINENCGITDRTVCQGCKDYISTNQINLRLKCQSCGYEFTILSMM